MKDNLQDLIAHTAQLGFIDLLKVTGSSTETVFNAVAEDRTVIINGKFKVPETQFNGIFGMPNLNKLKTILSFEEYAENAVITLQLKKNEEGEDVPGAIHFETANGDFVNDYRLMAQSIAEDRVRPVKFAGATWNISFEPKVASILRLKKQASANSEETVFVTKTDNAGNLKIYFGDTSSHSGNFIFESGVAGTLSRGLSWPVKQFLSIMDLQGDKHIYISEQGAMRITVDSGISEYEYLLPAQAR